MIGNKNAWRPLLIDTGALLWNTDKTSLWTKDYYGKHHYRKGQSIITKYGQINILEINGLLAYARIR